MPSLVSDIAQQLLGVWKLESHYMESRTGEKKYFFGEKPHRLPHLHAAETDDGSAHSRAEQEARHR
jgi:hypothetical protein